jgi:hypothetical protein
MSGMVSGTGNARAALSERGDDLYETPPCAVRALLSVEAINEPIWEPACGPGNIVRELRLAGHTVVATDLVDYGLEDSTPAIDFLMETKPQGQMIVTNPPFKLAHEFVVHALHLCPRVTMLLRLAFLESEKRRPILDTGQLARVHVFRKRLPMMHRAGWTGNKVSNPTAFAWFVWDRSHQGPTTLHRLSWEPFADRKAA